MDTIERVSEITGGKDFQALDQQALRSAYKTIGELEPELYETISFRPRQSLHWAPLGLALLLYGVYHGLGTWRSWRSGRATRVA
jgi:Ca-activated chloride channel family protein